MTIKDQVIVQAHDEAPRNPAVQAQQIPAQWDGQAVQAGVENTWSGESTAEAEDAQQAEGAQHENAGAENAAANTEQGKNRFCKKTASFVFHSSECFLVWDSCLLSCLPAYTARNCIGF